MQILDNEAPELYRDAMEASNSTCQQVWQNNHKINITERETRRHKENFIRMLIGIDTKFPMYMWDHLIQ